MSSASTAATVGATVAVAGVSWLVLPTNLFAPLVVAAVAVTVVVGVYWQTSKQYAPNKKSDGNASK